jgi:trehalose 6-phosphate phosphatase
MTLTMPIHLDSGECRTAPELWDRICSAFVQHRRLFVFADFDGTLSELVDVPSKAVPDPETGRALRRLLQRRRVSVAVISGRSVADVAGRVGLPLVFAGDHGLHIHAPDFDFVHPEAEAFRKQLGELSNQIRQSLQHVSGALVEAKTFSASVHYRHVPPENVAAVREAVSERLEGSAFELREGHCVFEVRPRLKWDKGDAVAWLLQRSGAEPEQAICIGDDQTDEDMFRRVPDAVTIRVSSDYSETTAAAYILSRTAVAEFLHGLADVAEGCGDCAV